MVFRDRTIRRLFGFLSALGIAIPIVATALVYPEIRELILSNATRDAEKVASHLTTHLFLPNGELAPEDDFRREAHLLKDAFGLNVIRLFDPSGRLIYSTSSADAGFFNDLPYFHEIVETGHAVSHFVRKGGATLEKETVAADILETYIPMYPSGGASVRAVAEIYYNIDFRQRAFRQTLVRTIGTLLVVSGLSLTALIVLLRHADRETMARRIAEDALRNANETLEEHVFQRTKELERANTELQTENAERKRVQTKLGESEAKFRSITSAARDAIIMVDMEARITFWNPAATELFGYRTHETLGVKLNDLIIPDRYLDDFQVGFSRFGFSGHGPFTGRTVDSTALTKDGDEIAVEISIAPVRIQGQWHALGVVRDVSERNRTLRALWESTVRFQKLFEDSPDPAVLFRRSDLSVSDINDAALRLFGMSKAEARKEGIWGNFDEPYTETLRRNLMRIDPSYPAFHLDEIPVRTRDGRERVLTIHGRVLATGDNPSLFCGLLDVTGRVDLSRNFRHSMKRLIQAEKMAFLGTMISGFAHDLNNPNQLFSVNLPLFEKLWVDVSPVLERHARETGDFFLAGLPYSEIADQIPEMIRDMKSGSERIDGIIASLLDYSREEQDGERESIRINDVVEASITVLKPKIKETTRAFAVELAPDLPPLIGNRQQLEQVVVNLIRNAVEALPAPENGVRVLTGRGADADTVFVRVEDDGTGIPDSLLDKVRRPFFTTKHGRGGTGLGLAICDNVVTAHQGSLDVRPGENGGTMVTVILPIRSHASAAPAPGDNG